MDTIFLVKKDLTSKGKEVEWLTLNQEQFKEFLKTDESKGRSFVKIEDDICGQAPRIYCEVDGKAKKEMLVNKRHSQYINDMRKKYNYQTVSYQCMNEELENSCVGEDVISDNVDFVDNVIEKLLVEELLSKLSSDEKWLLNELFLSNDPKSERELSKLSNIPQKTINDRKRRLLNKLRNFF